MHLWQNGTGNYHISSDWSINEFSGSEPYNSQFGGDGGGGGSWQPVYGGGSFSSGFTRTYLPAKQRYGWIWQKEDFNISLSKITGWKWVPNPWESSGSLSTPLTPTAWLHAPIDEIFPEYSSLAPSDRSRGVIPEYLRRCGMCHNPEGHYYDALAGYREAFWMNVIGIMGAADIGLMFATLPAKATSTAAITSFYPANNGFLGAAQRTFLRPGQLISRYGSTTGRYFSPLGTPLSMRALPPGFSSIYNTYKVVKPFEVQFGRIAPAFGQSGLGTQFLSPVPTSTLLRRGIIIPY